MDNESDDAEDLCGQIESLSISSSVQSGASSSPLKTRTTNRPIHGCWPFVLPINHSRKSGPSIERDRRQGHLYKH